MPAINQKIPNFLGGVSQQPDTIKYPGQVRVCDNAVPDVTFGLQKRPPGEFVKTLTNVNDTGYWYDILRDGDEKFLVQMTPSNTNYTGTKPIRIWNLLTGVEQSLTNANGDAVFNYMLQTGGPPFARYETQTIQDYTIITNPKKEVSTTGNTAAAINSGNYSFARLETIAHNTEYALHTQTNPPSPNEYWRVTAVKVDLIRPTAAQLADNAGNQAAWATDKPYRQGMYVTHDGGKVYQCAYHLSGIHNGSFANSNSNANKGPEGTGTWIADDTVAGGSWGSENKMRWDYRFASATDATLKGNSWTSGDDDSRFAGLGQFSFSGGNNIDVPNDASGTYAGASGSSTLVITETNHNRSAGDKIDVVFHSGALDSSGVYTEYIIDSVVSASEYRIIHSFNGTPNGGCHIRVTTQDIEGHVTVNGAQFVVKNNPNLDGYSQSNDGWMGWTQAYHTEYSSQIVLKDGGIIKTNNKDIALRQKIQIEIEGHLYQVTVVSVEPYETYEGIPGICYYRTPKDPEAGKLGMNIIIKELQDSVNANLDNVTAEAIGNGLYLHGTDAPDVTFLGGAINESVGMIGVTSQNISRLPNQCKHGYVTQIANDDNTEADNYYVKFIADNGTKGTGKWEECVRPHQFQGTGSDQTVVLGLDPANMPHALVNNRNNTFTFKKLDKATADAAGNDLYWKDREVGDNETNPFPSFKGKNIQKIFFHRNRLGMIADEQVVLSRPGDYFNFFVVSAITSSDDNPVDITVSDVKPAFVNHVLPINKGVMLFSDNGQFLLFTESDIMSPKTARIKKVSGYECDASIEPVDMGTSVMFTSNVSAYTRAYEATILDDDVPVKMLEQTRVVPEYIPKNVTMSANSTAVGVVSFAAKNSSDLYHFKYFESGEKRDQAAWYSWTLTGTMQHMMYTAGSFYVVTKQGSNYILNRYEYVADADATRTYALGSGTVGSSTTTARWFEACLDNMTIPTAINYTAQGGSITGPDFTELTIPYTPTSASNLYAVALSGTDTTGSNVAGTVIKATSVGTNKATFENIDMTGWTVAVGYSYTTTVELPTYYANLGQNQYDLDGDLRISGFNFEMGVSGPMEFHLSSVYTDIADYVHYESGMRLDDSDFGKPPATLSKSVRVPIQRKNEKYKLTIKIPDPFSTALISGSWDGIYNQRRHARK